MLQKTLQSARVSDHFSRRVAQPLLGFSRRRIATSMSHKGSISDKQVVVVGANRGIGLEVSPCDLPACLGAENAIQQIGPHDDFSSEMIMLCCKISVPLSD